MFYDTDDLTDGEVRLVCYRKAEKDEKRDLLPAYYFRICHERGANMGFCDLRVGYNGSTFYGGNIGYSISPIYRGHGYAAKAVRLLLKLAEKHGMEYVIITAKPDNTASCKTIENCGGIFLDVRKMPEGYGVYGSQPVMCRRYKIKL